MIAWWWLLVAVAVFLAPSVIIVGVTYLHREPVSTAESPDVDVAPTQLRLVEVPPSPRADEDLGDSAHTG